MKSDSPESRRSNFKLDVQLSLARLVGAEMDHAAVKLFHGLCVFDSKKLADLYRQSQLDERTVSIHDILLLG